jgi:uncharacterized membrane protein
MFLKRIFHADKNTATIANLFGLCNIRATKSHIRKTLISHPDYPSLLSLAESLLEWGVGSEAVKGTVKDLSEADCPAIAHLNNRIYVVLKGIRNNRVKLIHPTEGTMNMSMDDFSEIWSGVLLRVFPGKESKEIDYRSHRKNEWISKLQKISTFVGLPLLINTVFFYSMAHTSGLKILLPLGIGKIAGFIVCAVMVAGSIGGSRVLKSICPTGKVADCSRVMASPAGKLFGIPMAEWGLLYFTGGFMSIFLSLLTGRIESSLYILGILAFLALPYTIFSIAYQAFVVRSWCWLCLVVQALFWFEFIVLYGFISRRLGSAGWTLPLPIISGFGFVLLTWVALRPVLKSVNRADAAESEITRMRRRPEYIQAQLSRTDKTNMGRFPFEVEIGPAAAPITLIEVVNPMCGHCAQPFNQLERLIKLGKGQIKGVIRFLVLSKDDEMTDTEKMLDHEVAVGILSLAEAGKREDVRNALSSWFSSNPDFSRRKFEKWRENYLTGIMIEHEKIADILSLHRKWAGECAINVTPTLFMDGLRLPPGMQVEDLKYLLYRQLNH